MQVDVSRPRSRTRPLSRCSSLSPSSAATSSSTSSSSSDHDVFLGLTLRPRRPQSPLSIVSWNACSVFGAIDPTENTRRNIARLTQLIQVHDTVCIQE
eukprot:2612263-Pyramimonas_sp.AAC.1